ncbi:MAG: helix-turn-helix transcriptional regulator [Actinomycetaceae bacterium]|nr:helix-turn-helix transcriptional regulator [Actinomycetaceae bacterium]
MTSTKLDYKPLWKLLINREMMKTDLQKANGLSAATIAKLGRGGNVTTDVLVRICEALDCQLADIVEIVKGN